MFKATETRARARFAVIVSVSAALTAAACGGATDSQTDPSIMPAAGSPSLGSAGAAAGHAGSAGAAPQGTAGIAAPHAGSGAGAGGSPIITGSAGMAGSAGASGATAAGAGRGAAGMSAAAGAGAAGASGSAGAATFSAVYSALFAQTAAPGCFGCHGGAANPSLNGNFALVTDKATAFTGLVGAMSSEAGMCKGMTRVKAGDPTSSLLYLKIAGTPSCGTMMPPGGMVPAATVTLVKDWITAGAKND